jgi:hypothetical protein
MFEDIFIIPKSTKVKKPTNRINIKIGIPMPPPKPALTAFEIVKSVEDVRTLGKILDLCKVRIRSKKRKARRARKRR